MQSFSSTFIVCFVCLCETIFHEIDSWPHAGIMLFLKNSWNEIAIYSIMQWICAFLAHVYIARSHFCVIEWDLYALSKLALILRIAFQITNQSFQFAYSYILYFVGIQRLPSSTSINSLVHVMVFRASFYIIELLHCYQFGGSSKN